MALKYDEDGGCHNSQRHWMGQECGKPARWIGTKANGFRSGFCDQCRQHGDEAHAYLVWEPV